VEKKTSIVIHVLALLPFTQMDAWFWYGQKEKGRSSGLLEKELDVKEPEKNWCQARRVQSLYSKGHHGNFLWGYLHTGGFLFGSKMDDPSDKNIQFQNHRLLFFFWCTEEVTNVQGEITAITDK